MPQLAGTKLPAKIKQTNSGIRAILCSGNLNRDFMSDAIDHYCRKPYDLSQLVAAIDRLVERGA